MKEEEESPTTTTTTKPSNVDDTESEPDLERQAMDKYTMHAGRRECRICLSQDDESEWVQPCQCSGSLSWTHLECLRRWVKESHHLKCEICLSEFQPELVEGISTEPAIGPVRSRYDVDSEAQRPDPNASSPRNWKPVIVTVGILAVLIGVFVLVGLNIDKTWAQVLLRVVAFSLPALLIMRVVWVYYRKPGGERPTPMSSPH